MFPVGAICRVVDIIHFSDDKDQLTREEIWKIQNNYVDEILEEGKKHHLRYLQYLIGIVVNSKKEILYIENPDLFNAMLIYDKGDYFECISEHWKNVFDNEKSNWKAIGKCKMNDDIRNYYMYELDEEAVHTLKIQECKWLKLEDYLEKTQDTFIRYCESLCTSDAGEL